MSDCLHHPCVQELIASQLYRESMTGLAIVRPDGVFAHANESYTELVGRAVLELQQLHFREITHPEDIRLDERMAKQVQEGTLPFYDYNKRYLHKVTGERWVILRVSAIRDEEVQVPTADGKGTQGAFVAYLAQARRVHFSLKLAPPPARTPGTLDAITWAKDNLALLKWLLGGCAASLAALGYVALQILLAKK